MKLGTVLYRWRTMTDLTLREAAKEMGITSPALMRVEHGHDPSAATLVKIILWATANSEKDRKVARSRKS